VSIGKNNKQVMNNQPIIWLGDRIRIIDQTRLPHEEIYPELDDYHEVASAIRELKIRGAPAIGIAGAYAVALGALKTDGPMKDFTIKLDEIINTIAGTRPTARNLFFTLERMKKVVDSGTTAEGTRSSLVDEAIRIHAEETEATMRLSHHGAGLIQNGWTILTHCNTGPLATTGYGTALGIIVEAANEGKKVNVFADETRPLLQGARLTTWELQKAGVPVTLITDSMAGYFMKTGKIDCVITGADRIAANGDTANKIGTYTLAVLAKENGVPFYIAAPISTIDTAITTGENIPIEERSANEVTSIQGVSIAPKGTIAANPAFDITPHEYISAIITEKGIIEKPFHKGISDICRS
jgi:methylthioribose-1-phosphate isomerase